jgi:hypothetical protein
LEVISICWDAIDGSTLFEILDLSTININTANATRFLMAFWYLSVGIRMAIIFLTQATPSSRGYQLVLAPPLALAPQPTVDRTFQGLRLRYGNSIHADISCHLKFYDYNLCVGFDV